MSDETATNPQASRAVVEVPPSGSWDGNDGPWSTFAISVGTPPQSFRVLVSTCSEEAWVVSANRTLGGCSTLGSKSDCPERRGGLFNASASSTWDEVGAFTFSFFDADFSLPDFNGMHEPGNSGTDTLALGPSHPSEVILEHQNIVAYATDYWHLGFLGVLGVLGQGGSIVSSLNQLGSTASLTFAYSAGARYRSNSTATLTFGGYDKSKFTENSGVSLSMTQASGESPGGLFVSVQSIIVNDATNTSLLPNGIPAVIEASIPHIWLPLEACTLFEKAFGIVYNSAVERYLVNETLHRRLQIENPSVSFLLYSNFTYPGNDLANFTLPYASFDLELGPPLVNNTQRYFPLRRAENASHFVLGRTFLQEAYLIVDCERSNFSLYPMAWNSAAVPQLTTILGNAAADVVQTPPAREFAAIIISVISICGLIIGLVLEYRMKERVRKNLKVKERSQAPNPEAYIGKPEMDPEGRVQGELHADKLQKEADGSNVLVEMYAGQLPELGGDAEMSELRGTDGGIEKGE